MNNPEQPSDETEQSTAAQGCLDHGLVFLTVVMPLAAAAVVAFGVGGFVGTLESHWLAIVAGVIGFVVTLACLFVGLRGQIDFIIIPLGIIIMAAILFPIFAKIRARRMQERIQHQRQVPARPQNSARP